ncbi:MAG: MFS transporter [Leptothrix sp. (in: b-proteobacteria)]
MLSAPVDTASACARPTVRAFKLLPQPGPDWSPTAWRDYCGLSAAIAMVGLALGMVLPLTALRLAHAGHGSALTGLLLAVQALGLMLAMPLTGRALARGLPRQVLRRASLGAALVCVALGAATGAAGAALPLVLGLGLLLLGCLLGLVFNLVETWVNQVIPPAQRGRWLAVHCTIFTLFQLGGPLLLPFLPEGQAFGACGVLLLLAWPALRGLSAHRLTDDDVADGAAPPWWRLLLEAPAIVWSTALFALFDALVLGLLPLYARAHGLNEAAALASASVVLAGDTALEWLVGLLADRYGRVPVHVGCALTLLVAAPLLPLAIGSWLWWPLLFAIGAAAGGIYVLSLVASGQRYSGRPLLQLTALLGATWGAASSVGPLLTGVLMQASPVWALPGVLLLSTTLLLAALAREQAMTRDPARDPARDSEGDSVAEPTPEPAPAQVPERPR